ncbi:MAG: hypothetical protein LBK52_01010 [Deltaproteobacteria bacterium]|jgi:hypothetical protein|nr:hypothetical protein [Deltaproteobacteria bacterium]
MNLESERVKDKTNKCAASNSTQKLFVKAIKFITANYLSPTKVFKMLIITNKQVSKTNCLAREG